MTTSDRVSANYRYIAAYNEVNARIAQRQQALSLYITLIVGLIAALVASKRIEGQDSLPIEWLVSEEGIAGDRIPHPNKRDHLLDYCATEKTRSHLFFTSPELTRHS